ncbi:Tetratricopeptide repeat protein 1 [Grifola frondosa]|uniref:Tetratricopeptide repeat protein 1 n=1 Tax=Grifola frondosa TaxID=5627 RepID=A0A1C7MSR8_GRIFR|nr:Tetratricopeptide repeat protein 1 [Grifola frondosa]
MSNHGSNIHLNPAFSWPSSQSHRPRSLQGSYLIFHITHRVDRRDTGARTMENSLTSGPSTETADVREEVNAELYDESQIKTCLKDAEDLKLEGNDHFRAKRWDEALATYTSALGRLPKRKESPPPSSAKENGKGRNDTSSDTEDAEDTHKSTNPEGVSSVEEDTIPPTELEVQCAKARSIMSANIGACYVKLGDHKEAVAACSQALKDDPHYIKALQRRAASNEQINTWSSLSSAQEDYNLLLELLPAGSPQINEVKRSLQSLKPRVEASQKRETAEMLDKLKGLGNSILGNFGLSTDNFQFVPNGQGGYSMNFVR